MGGNFRCNSHIFNLDLFWAGTIFNKSLLVLIGVTTTQNIFFQSQIIMQVFIQIYLVFMDMILFL